MSHTKKASECAPRNQNGINDVYEKDAKESGRKSDVPHSAKSQHRESKITDLVYKYLGDAKPPRFIESQEKCIVPLDFSDTNNSNGSLDEVSPQSSTSDADNRIRMASDEKRSRKHQEGSKFTNKYIRDALAFGIRSGCLIPVDSNCRVLRVSSALTNVKDCRDGMNANERSLSRQKREHSSQYLAKGEIQDAGRRKRRSKRRRSRTRSRSSRKRKVHRGRSRSHEDSRGKSPEASSKSKKTPVAKRNEDPEDPDDYEVYSGDEDDDSKRNSNSQSNDGKKGKTANSSHPDEDTNDTNDNEVDEYVSDNSIDEDVSDDDEAKND